MSKQTPPSPPTRPGQASDGLDTIPYRAANRPRWKYMLLAISFIVWLAVLALLYWIGRP
ncbi:MAG: hypothetical protein HQ546_07655 [Planctomycetes bacterium]|nr:hypothetical protein [Planctomycetota bacterium]